MSSVSPSSQVTQTMKKAPEDYDFFSEEVLECPFDFYKLLREEAPVYLLPGTNIYLVTRHADIKVMLKDTGTFSSDFAHLLSGPDEPDEVKALYEGEVEPANTLLTLDPPGTVFIAAWSTKCSPPSGWSRCTITSKKLLTA
jgi:cytochrome P450